jgi:O-antigen/teichoic acid export membrane protein
MTDERPAGRQRYDYFDDADISQNMGSRIARGGAFLFGASAIRFGINLVSTIILARLLSPEDYGLLAMVLVVTNFTTLFQDMNLSLATVQQKNITHAQVSTIYWVNIGITAAISVTILAAAPGIAWFYGEPRLTAIAMMLCAAIAIRGGGAQHKALLRRKMQFGAIATIETLSMLIGYIVAILIAWNGGAYWSLVWLHIVMAAANTLLSWGFSRWRPGRPVRGAGIRPMLVFGGNLTGFTLLRYPARSLDRVIIGWQTGAAPVGLYSKCFELIGPITAYVTTPINSIAIPALSRLIDTPKRYSTAFRRFTEAVALITLPMAVVIICTADDIVLLLLGQKWMAAAPLLAIVGLLVFVEGMGSALQWLFVSQGRGGELLRYGAIDSVLRAGAILVGLIWGVQGIAIAIVATALFGQLPIQVWYACRSGPVRMADFYRAITPVVLASIVAFCTILLLRHYFPAVNPAIAIAEAVLVAGCAVLAVLFGTSSGRALMRQLWGHVPKPTKLRHN